MIFLKFTKFDYTQRSSNGDKKSTTYLAGRRGRSVDPGRFVHIPISRWNNNEIFDDSKSFCLWAYNIETVLAEKVETILRRTVFNTRPRDFYDAYILATTQKYDKILFAQAMQATAAHRGPTEQITDVVGIIQDISESAALRVMWDKYRKQFSYAKDISFEMILGVLRDICRVLS